MNTRLLITLLCFSFLLYLIFSFPITIFPEMRLFPYLVSRGRIPYIDFFDHHGFLLYYLLAPFVSPSIFPYKIFFISLSTLSFFLFSLILSKEVKNHKVFSIALFTFTVFHFYLNDNTLWYETLALPLMLCLYLSVSKLKNNSSKLISGFLVFYLSLIKPIYILAGILLVIKKRDFRPLLIPLLGWFIVLVIYSQSGGVSLLINSLFLYNYKLSQVLKLSFTNDLYYFIPLLFLIIIAIFYIIPNKSRKIFYTFLLFISSLPLLTSTIKTHLILILPFLLIIMTYTQKLNLKYKKISALIVIFLSLFLLRKITMEHKDIYKRNEIYITDSESKNIVNYIQTNKLPNIVVFANRPEVYTNLSVIPKIYYPLKFPFMEIMNPRFQTKYLDEISKHSIRYIVITKEIESEYKSLPMVLEWISKNTIYIYQDDYFEIRSVTNYGDETKL